MGLWIYHSIIKNLPKFDGFWEARKRRKLSLPNTLAKDTFLSSHRYMGGGRRQRVSKGCEPPGHALFVEGGILGVWKEKPRLFASPDVKNLMKSLSSCSGTIRWFSRRNSKVQIKILVHRAGKFLGWLQNLNWKFSPSTILNWECIRYL